MFTNAKKTFLNFLKTTFITLPTGLLSFLAYGFTLSCLWSWFIKNTFSLPDLALIPATGIVIIITFLSLFINDSKVNPKNNIFTNFFDKIQIPIGFLILGYIFQLFL